MDEISETWLDQWCRRIAAIGNDLLSLSEMDSYRLLTGADKFEQVRLDGVSKRMVEPVISKIPMMWQVFAILSEQIDRAEGLRRSVKHWKVSDKSVKEIARLLKDQTIELPTGAASTLDFQETKFHETEMHVQVTSAEDLCNALERLFTEVKEQVQSVDLLWLKLPQMLASQESEIPQLQNQAKALAEDCDNQIATIRETIVRLRLRIPCDPIGVRDDLKISVSETITSIRRRLEETEVKRAQLNADIRRCRQTLASLKQTRIESHAAYLKARDKITDAPGLIAPLSIEQLDDLESWLGKVEEANKNGFWKPVLVGLQKWRSAAEELLTQEYAALAANRAPLELRDDLRGRLSALIAKATASTKSSAAVLDPTPLNAAAAEAEKALYAARVSLPEAAALVAKYQEIFSQTINSLAREG